MVAHLEALDHASSYERLGHGSSKQTSLNLIGSRHIKLDQSGDVAAAQGVCPWATTGASSGVSKAPGDDPIGIGGCQAQGCGCACYEGG